MIKNKAKLGRFIYIVAIVTLTVSFILAILEKAQVLNLYSKPIAENIPEYVEPEKYVKYENATPTDNEDINSKKESGDIIQSDDQDTQKGEPINIALTAATQDTPGGPIIVRVLVNNANKGDCSILLEKNSQTIEYTKKVIRSGTYYSCEPVDIPFNEVDVGKWDLMVTVKDENRTGSASAVVEVKE